MYLINFGESCRNCLFMLLPYTPSSPSTISSNLSSPFSACKYLCHISKPGQWESISRAVVHVMTCLGKDPGKPHRKLWGSSWIMQIYAICDSRCRLMLHLRVSMCKTVTVTSPESQAGAGMGDVILAFKLV